MATMWRGRMTLDDVVWRTSWTTLRVFMAMQTLMSPWTSTVNAHGAGHSVPGSSDASSQGFHDSRVVQDADHINEHLQGKASVNVSEMSLEELEFHYFKMHDFDNNTMLDGLEIFKALTHLLPYDDVDDEHKKVDTRGKTPDEIARERAQKELQYYVEIVDGVLRDDDIDDDGFLTYPEYIIARRREEARELREEMSHSTTRSGSGSSGDASRRSSHRH